MPAAVERMAPACAHSSAAVGGDFGGRGIISAYLPAGAGVFGRNAPAGKLVGSRMAAVAGAAVPSAALGGLLSAAAVGRAVLGRVRAGPVAVHAAAY